MNFVGFTLDIIMELIALYLSVIFFRSYSKTHDSNFLVLSSALLIFFILDAADNLGSNIFGMTFFEKYFFHHISVIFILLALVYIVKSPPSWKMKLEKEKKVA